MRHLQLTTCLLLALLLSACAQSTLVTPEPTTLTIAGSTAMRPVLLSLTEAFSRQNSQVLFDLRGGGSTLGEARVREGDINLAASTLFPPQLEDETSGSSPGSPLQSVALVRIPIGLDGIAVVVHPQNEVAGLSLSELREVFAGRLFDWNDVANTLETSTEGSQEGGQRVIQLVSREEGSGTRIAFEERVMEGEAVSLTAIVQPTSTDVVDYVQRNPNAVGYVSIAYAQPQDGESPVRTLPIDGQLPSDEAISDRSYPLLQPLYLISRGEPQEWSRQFIDFVLSPAGQRIVDRFHVPVR